MVGVDASFVDHRPGNVEQHLILIGIKLPHRKAAAPSWPGKGVRERAATWDHASFFDPF